MIQMGAKGIYSEGSDDSAQKDRVREDGCSRVWNESGVTRITQKGSTWAITGSNGLV